MQYELDEALQNMHYALVDEAFTREHVIGKQVWAAYLGVISSRLA